MLIASRYLEYNVLRRGFGVSTGGESAMKEKFYAGKFFHFYYLPNFTIYIVSASSACVYCRLGR